MKSLKNLVFDLVVQLLFVNLILGIFGRLAVKHGLGTCCGAPNVFFYDIKSEKKVFDPPLLERCTVLAELLILNNTTFGSSENFWKLNQLIYHIQV